MKTNELDTLLGRYYEGLTTRDEEQRLRQLLTANDYPQYDADRAVFGLIGAKRKIAEKQQRRAWTFSRVAAMLAVVFCIGAAAATITYHVVVEKKTDTQQTIEQPTSQTATKNDVPTKIQEETVLPDSIIFKNQPLSEIAKQIIASFGCKVELADSATAGLRLYLTLPKGSGVGYFVETIDAYDALEATLKEDIITIKRQETQQ